jgi:cytochrome c peroxidase
MSRQEAWQAGPRVTLASGVTWEDARAHEPGRHPPAQLAAGRIQATAARQAGTGGQVFPNQQIDAINRLEQRDLRRFDVDFDLPDPFTPDFRRPST